MSLKLPSMPLGWALFRPEWPRHSLDQLAQDLYTASIMSRIPMLHTTATPETLTPLWPWTSTRIASKMTETMAWNTVVTTGYPC